MIYLMYGRVSSDGQKEGDGSDRQKRVVDSKYRIEQYYIDHYTGTKDLRPALEQLFLEIYQYLSIDEVTVCIEQNDRLARDLVIQEMIVVRFINIGVSVISVQTGLDLCEENPNNVYLRQLMGATAEYGKNILVARLKAGREAKKRKLIAAGERGKVGGKKAYWQKCPRVVEEIVWLRSYAGRRSMVGINGVMGYGSIAKIINDIGYKTMDGDEFNKNTIRGILKTEGVE